MYIKLYSLKRGFLSLFDVQDPQNHPLYSKKKKSFSFMIKKKIDGATEQNHNTGYNFAWDKSQE